MDSQEVLWDRAEKVLIMRIVFLDIDGVLNCDIFFKEKFEADYKAVKKDLKKQVKKGAIDRSDYYNDQICPVRVDWLNELCDALRAKVVISSTWRMGKTPEIMQDILDNAGASFEVIGCTPVLTGDGIVRGNEILKWMYDNEQIIGCSPHDYKDYVIIDDDSDMLLWQASHFFQTDSYSGLTHNTCYKIKRFFGVNPYN